MTIDLGGLKVSGKTDAGVGSDVKVTILNASNQTIRDARACESAKSNPYFDDENLVEDKYYKFKGAD